MVDLKETVLRSEREITSKWKDQQEVLVSVLCATFNHESYVEDAIIGFLSQETDFAFEVIIKDDASSDSTAEIIKRYHALYPRLIKPILLSENQFSKGLQVFPMMLKNVTSKYIALCEGDDYWVNTKKLQQQFNILENQPNVSLCFHPAIELNISEGSSKSVCDHFNENRLVRMEDLIIGRGGYMPTASLFFKNVKLDKLIESLKGAPIEDFFIQVFMSSIGGAYYINEPMCVYRRNALGSWTESQKNLDKKLNYAYSMVSAINVFINFIDNESSKRHLFRVNLKYATTYIKLHSGRFQQLKAFIKLSKLCNQNNKLTFFFEGLRILIRH